MAVEAATAQIPIGRSLRPQRCRATGRPLWTAALLKTFTPPVPARSAPCCPMDRGTRSRAAPRADQWVLQHLGARGLHVLKGRVEIVDTEYGHRQNALGKQFLQGVAVGGNRPACSSESTISRPG